MDVSFESGSVDPRYGLDNRYTLLSGNVNLLAAVSFEQNGLEIQRNGDDIVSPNDTYLAPKFLAER